jgi:hypothetical protein
MVASAGMASRISTLYFSPWSAKSWRAASRVVALRSNGTLASTIFCISASMAARSVSVNGRGMSKS